jgi:hypothetical protein
MGLTGELSIVSDRDFKLRQLRLRRRGSGVPITVTKKNSDPSQFGCCHFEVVTR